MAGYKIYKFTVWQNGKEVIRLTGKARNRGNALKNVAKILEKYSGGEGEEYMITLSPAYRNEVDFLSKTVDERINRYQ